MNPIVEAAWITAGVGALGIISTSTVAILGSRSTRLATTDTIKAGRDDKLRDKRAEVYIDLPALLAVQQERRDRMRRDLEAAMLGQRVALPQPDGDWHMTEARLQAFATAEAFTLVQAYSITEIGVERAWQACVSNDNPESVVPRLKLIAAVKSADKAAGELVERVRRDLIGPGPELADIEPDPDTSEPAG